MINTPKNILSAILCRADKRNSRSGTALIVALGLVAVLLIICVAFTIDMRVERSGAANLRHASQARQLVKGAVASMIATVDQSIGEEAVPPWFRQNDDGTFEPTWSDKVAPVGLPSTFPNYSQYVRRVHMFRDTLVSFDTSVAGAKLSTEDYQLSSTKALSRNLVSADAVKYLPSGLAYKGFATKYQAKYKDDNGQEQVVDLDIDPPEWIPMYARGSTDLIGRYSFVVFNTTGLIDLSAAKGTEERWMGKDPAEIELSDKILPDVADPKKLFNTAGRYESYAELADLNEGIVEGECRSFNTFSYEPSDTNKIDISTLDNILDKKDEIIAAFYDCGLTASSDWYKKCAQKKGVKSGAKDSEQARWAYLGLVDFVDGDSEMESDDVIDDPCYRPATEAMPLMSGFIAKIKFKRRQCATKVENGDGTEEWAIDNTKCEFKVDSEFKVPFVCPTYPNTEKTFEVEAKAKLWLFEAPDGDANSPWLKVFPDLIAKDSKNVEYNPMAEIAVSGLKPPPMTANGWAEVPNDGDGNPREIDFPFRAIAAGSTRLGKKAVRRFPVRPDDYGEGDLDEGDPGCWMTVDVNPADYGYKFIEVGQERYDSSVPSSPMVKVWEMEMVVFAEFNDPRFSCMDMMDVNGGGFDSESLHHWVYHTSHGRKEAGALLSDIDIPVVELRSDGGYGYMGYEKFKKASGVDYDKLYDDYFPKDGDLPFASPLATYLLGKPSDFLRMYPVNADGIRNSAGADDNTEPAYIKWRSYVKNAELESVGELGYIPIGIWNTIRLYDYGDRDWDEPVSADVAEVAKYNKLPFEGDEAKFVAFHPVLDYFTVNPGVSGKVNVNTMEDGILSSVFNHMPIGTESEGSELPPPANYESEATRVPAPKLDSKTGKRKSVYDAVTLAQLIKKIRAGNDDGIINNLSDLGYLFVSGDEGEELYGDEGSTAVNVISEIARQIGAHGMDFGEWEREALIRNACGLLSTRGQTFVAVVRAESYSPKFGKTSVDDGTVNAAKTAVVQFWRDTVPQNVDTGKTEGPYKKKVYKKIYPVFIQFFKILDD